MDRYETDNSAIPAPAQLSHAYIIWGGNEADRSAYADTLAMAAVCQGSGRKPCHSCIHCSKAARHIHPDIITVEKEPETRMIYVDQIRALREDAVIMPNEALKKVYIIQAAGLMNTNAQNALLKFLEEPPVSTNFILTAENPAELLPTIRSRCIELSADRHAPASPVAASDIVMAFYSALTGGPLKLTEFSFQLEKLDKQDFADFISGAKAYFTQKLKDSLNGEAVGLSPAELMKAVTVLDRAREFFNNNVGLIHISGMICAELIIRNEENNV